MNKATLAFNRAAALANTYDVIHQGHYEGHEFTIEREQGGHQYVLKFTLWKNGGGHLEYVSFRSLSKGEITVEVESETRDSFFDEALEQYLATFEMWAA